MTVQPLLQLKDIRRTFTASGRNVTAVNGVSLELAAGETLGIVGESGSGKSTLGRIAVGLDQPSNGQVIIEGADTGALATKARREHFRKCQMIFQDPYASLNPRLTVARQIGEGLFASGRTDWKAINDEVAELFRKVGLRPEQMQHYPHEFSGGQRQRIAIARALAPGPAIVVADEPVSALDVTIQAQILDLLIALQDEISLSYLFISHDIAVVAHISDRIAVMHKGRIVEFGTTIEIIRNPQHPYTQNLLAAVPRLDRRRTGEKRSRPATPEHRASDRYEMLSPHHGVLVTTSVAG